MTERHEDTEELATSRDEAGEPSGEEDPANEQERLEAKEAALAGQRAKSGLVRELLPVVDNLERALASAGDEEQHLAEGVRLVHSELIAVLERNGVQPFDPAGQRFDPAEHEALSIREDEQK